MPDGLHALESNNLRVLVTENWQHGTYMVNTVVKRGEFGPFHGNVEQASTRGVVAVQMQQEVLLETLRHFESHDPLTDLGVVKNDGIRSDGHWNRIIEVSSRPFA
jgi:hypothetical protein